MKIIEQSVRDYCSLEWTNIPYRAFYWQTAHDFLFDDEYFIWWGDKEMNLEMISELVGLDIDWIRLKTKERYEKEQKFRIKKLEANISAEK